MISDLSCMLKFDILYFEIIEKSKLCCVSSKKGHGRHSFNTHRDMSYEIKVENKFTL